MNIYNASIAITYQLTGDLLTQYLEQLNGNEDTFTQRRDFLLDHFIPKNWREILDPNAVLTFEEIPKIGHADHQCHCLKREN